MNEYVSIHNIRKRLKGLALKESTQASIDISQKNMQLALESHNAKEIMKSIELALRVNPIQLESVLNLFDALYECESSTTGQLLKMKSFICEEAIPKVRDAKDMNTYLKRKLGMARSKVTTKIHNSIKKSTHAANFALTSAKNNFKNNASEIVNNINAGLSVKPKSKNESYLQCYEEMIHMSSIYEDCDRILDNYNNISKRFNLDKIFIENTRINGVKDTVFELCQYIETYDMPSVVKFNTVIETAWYGFEQNGIQYSSKELLEAATDYFITKPDGLKDCRTIFQNTVVFKPEDMPACVQPITEEEPTEDTHYESIFKMNADIQDSIQENGSLIVEATDFDKIFTDFKKSEDVTNQAKVKDLIRKLYAKSVSNIVEETPNLLSWIRYVFVLGVCAINIPLGFVSFIADLFIRLKYEREETSRMIKCFENEIKKSETKMKSINDPEEKKRLKEYIKSLESAKGKIESYYDDMLTEKEVENRYSGTDEKDTFDDLKADISDEDDDDIDAWFDDDEFSFDEAAVETIDNLSNLVNAVTTYENLETDTLNNLSIFNGDDIDALAKLSVTYPDVWSPELMEHVLENQIYKIRKNKISFESALERFQMVNCYENAITTIHNYKPIEVKTIGEAVIYTECLVSAMEAVASIIETNKNKSVMVEASFSNSLKIAGDKLKRTMKQLSDKDKAISKTVDTNIEVIKKEMENALTNENREAVIKGRILPPASKIIKLAITTGAIWIVNPALAVISALGYLGLSAKHKEKERRLILDEYEVELKMCEKYIDLAESKGNMKALKRLLLIQKNLQRQEQRLRYRMKVDFNNDVPDTASRSGR